MTEKCGYKTRVENLQKKQTPIDIAYVSCTRCCGYNVNCPNYSVVDEVRAMDRILGTFQSEIGSLERRAE